jgi:hypothetical protein
MRETKSFFFKEPMVILEGQSEVDAAYCIFEAMAQRRYGANWPTDDWNLIEVLEMKAEEYAYWEANRLKIRGEDEVRLLHEGASTLLQVELEGISFMNAHGFAASEELHPNGPAYIPALRVISTQAEAVAPVAIAA